MVVTEEILSELKKRGKKEKTKPELLEFYRKLLEIQYEAEQKLGVPEAGLSLKAASQRLGQGLPILRFEELTVDWAYLKDVFIRITELFREYASLFNKPLAPGATKKYGVTRLKRAIRAWFEGSELPVEPGDDAGNELDVLEDILQLTFKPFLTGYRKALISLVRPENWRLGQCPVCGGNPDFAYLDDESGARWLVCSRCDAEWLFQRLQCPCCGTQDQNDLAYFTDDEGRYRLYVCENCKQYLKALDIRIAKSEFIPPLERFFTFDIDAQAREYDYVPCGGSAARGDSEE
jgi:FdhE protein